MIPVNGAHTSTYIHQVHIHAIKYDMITVNRAHTSTYIHQVQVLAIKYDT